MRTPRCAPRPTRCTRAAAIPTAPRSATLLRSTTARRCTANCTGAVATALCLSGGGIRSASFALGIIEALAVHPRPATSAERATSRPTTNPTSYLRQCQYLSTVSGGGYIGSWLSALGRAGRLRACVVASLNRAPARTTETGADSEIAWLRAYSNYLTPRARPALGRHLGGDRALCAQPDPQLARDPAGALCSSCSGSRRSRSWRFGSRRCAILSRLPSSWPALP